MEIPQSSLLTRYVLENPWPAAIVLLAAAGIVGWMGFREGLVNRQRAAFVLALAAIAVAAIGTLITTSGERAKHLTRELVERTVSRDIVAAAALLSDDAVIAFGSPQNPGYGVEYINELLDRSLNHDIESNSITTLRGATESNDAGIAQLACATTVGGFPYPNVSQWLIRVTRQSDGAWKVSHITCVSVNNQTPSMERMR